MVSHGTKTILMWLTLIVGILTTVFGIITYNTYETVFFKSGWYGWNHIYPWLFIVSFIIGYISLRKYTDRTSPSDDINPRSLESSLARKQLVIHILSVAVFILVTYIGFKSLPAHQEYDYSQITRTYNEDKDQVVESGPFPIGALLLLLGAGLTAYLFYRITLWHFDLNEQVEEIRRLREIFMKYHYEPLTDSDIWYLRTKLSKDSSDFWEKKEKENSKYPDDTPDEKQKLVEIEPNAEIQKEPHIESPPPADHANEDKPSESHVKDILADGPNSKRARVASSPQATLQQDNKPQRWYNKVGQIGESVIKWFARL